MEDTSTEHIGVLATVAMYYNARRSEFFSYLLEAGGIESDDHVLAS